MTTNDYQLLIGGQDSLALGVYQAALHKKPILLEFYQHNRKTKQASLAPDTISFFRTQQRTEEKISLLCNRLGINKEELQYCNKQLPKFKRYLYQVALLPNLLTEILTPIQWAIVFKHAKDSEWQRIVPDSRLFQADPFIVYRNDKYYVFYEELKFEDYHGYLRAAELDIESGKLINDQVILKQDYHLSYPQVFEENGTYYMIPESADNSSIDLYECTDFPYQWQKKKTLLSNIEAVDTTPLKTEDGWYLFTSERITGADFNDELSIYKSTDLLTQAFEKLYQQPVISDVKNARMAGRFFRENGELYRVSQDCGKRYGHQVNVHKVLQIEGGYQEQYIKTISPGRGALGFHTYNRANGLEIGDMELVRFDYYSLKRFVGGNLKRALEIIRDTFIRNKDE